MKKLQIDLSGPDGNIFAIIGIVARKLQEVSGRPARNEFTTEALKCKDYDSILEYAEKKCKKNDIELIFKNRK